MPLRASFDKIAFQLKKLRTSLGVYNVIKQNNLFILDGFH